MTDKLLQKEWDSIIEKNKKKWAKDLYELLLKDKCWDVSFDRYTKYRIFVVHFETQIKEVLRQARVEFPEMDMTFEDIAHDLFLAVTEDENVIKEFEEATKQILKSLPRA